MEQRVLAQSRFAVHLGLVLEGERTGVDETRVISFSAPNVCKTICQIIKPNKKAARRQTNQVVSAEDEPLTTEVALREVRL